MKKWMLTFFAVGLFSAITQAQYYDFTVSSGTYSSITGITISGADWDDEVYKISPSYDVVVFGQVMDSLTFDDYEFVFYKAGLEIGYFSPCSVDLASLGGNSSPIKWAETGMSPNRILKIEFGNATTYNDLSGTPSDTVNYQVWFLENGNAIEIHFGDSKVVADGDDPWDGDVGPIVGTINTDSRGILLSGNVTTPTVNTVDINTSANYTLTGMPGNGLVYVFTPRINQVSVPTVAVNTTIAVYPNPFNNVLIINTEEPIDMTLTDAQGKIITIFTVDQAYELNTSDLSQGVYFLRGSNGFVKKVIK